jgi:hypothetical protein
MMIRTLFAIGCGGAILLLLWFLRAFLRDVPQRRIHSRVERGNTVLPLHVERIKTPRKAA